MILRFTGTCNHDLLTRNRQDRSCKWFFWRFLRDSSRTWGSVMHSSMVCEGPKHFLPDFWGHRVLKVHWKRTKMLSWIFYHVGWCRWVLWDGGDEHQVKHIVLYTDRILFLRSLCEVLIFCVGTSSSTSFPSLLHRSSSLSLPLPLGLLLPDSLIHLFCCPWCLLSSLVVLCCWAWVLATGFTDPSLAYLLTIVGLLGKIRWKGL